MDLKLRKDNLRFEEEVLGQNVGNRARFMVDCDAKIA
jgi:hypothetical protein